MLGLVSIFCFGVGSMTSIKVFVRRLEPDGTRSPISIRRPRPVATPNPPDDEEEPTLAERVFQFLDQRSA
jgi:hypothetical protein